LVLFLSVKVNAQKDSIQNYKESYITVNLLSHFNSYNPRWRFGYIKGINKNFKIGLDIGYGNKKLTPFNYGGSLSDNYRLFEIRPEFYYVDEYTKGSDLYLSLDLFYINQKDVFFNNSYFQESIGEVSYSRVNYNREKFGFNFKFGFIADLTERLKLNFYSGLGIKIKNNTYTDVVNPSDEGRPWVLFGNAYYYRKGTRVGLNLPLGLKLLYKL